MSKLGIRDSKSVVRYREQDLVNRDLFPNKQNNFIDIANDVVGTSLILSTASFAAFSMLGIELILKNMSAGSMLELYTSNGGDIAGVPIATQPLPTGDSKNIIQYENFAHKFLIFSFSGLSAGEIHNILVLGKNK